MRLWYVGYIADLVCVDMRRDVQFVANETE